MSETCDSHLIILLLPTSTSAINQGKIREMFLRLVTSQIINLKTIGDVLELRKCYQCGGETLVLAVKYSVSDASGTATECYSSHSVILPADPIRAYSQ